jgi:hypothetical protein
MSGTLLPLHVELVPTALVEGRAISGRLELDLLKITLWWLPGANKFEFQDKDQVLGFLWKFA